MKLQNAKMKSIKERSNPSIPAPNPTSNPPRLPHNLLVIRRISSSLIQKAHRLLVQLHKLPLERDVPHPRHLFIPIPSLCTAEVLVEEQSQAAGVVEECAFDGVLLNGVCARQVESLCGGEVFCGGEVEVEAVGEDFEGGGGGGVV